MEKKERCIFEDISYNIKVCHKLNIDIKENTCRNCIFYRGSDLK